MRGLFSFLMFALFFYVMMRFGCGAHMVHGHGGHKGHSDGSGANVDAKDPVCGMNVAPDAGYARMHKGRAYRFCSRQCLDQFDAAPERFAA